MIDKSQNKLFRNWADAIITEIKKSQTTTSLKVNTDMLSFYWFIGNSVLSVQKEHA